MHLRHPHLLPKRLLLLTLLAPAACATQSSTHPPATPEPWASALTEHPVPAHTYQPTFNTLAHHLLDLDSQVAPQPDAMYAMLLDSPLADARKTIPWNPR